MEELEKLVALEVSAVKSTTLRASEVRPINGRPEEIDAGSYKGFKSLGESVYSGGTSIRYWM